MTYRSVNRGLPDPIFLGTFSPQSCGPRIRGEAAPVPSSGNNGSAGRALFAPFYITKPYDIQRFWWQNGATVGTNDVMTAVYSIDGSGVLDCVVATARTLSAGTANALQFAGASVVAHTITSGTNTTDATSFATASVTLKARYGVMYLLSVINSHGSSPNTVTVATTGGAVTFTSRATVTWNSGLFRSSLFTAVPSADVTDTITITIGSSQTATACTWSLVCVTNVDTGTNDGIVQTATNSGTAATTYSATLAAFGSANNATFGFTGIGTVNSITAGTGFTTLANQAQSTPSGQLQTEFRSDNDTSVDSTCGVSSNWGFIAAEIKSLGTTRILAPGTYYHAHWCSGTTATFFRTSDATKVPHGGVYSQDTGLGVGLPFTPTLVATGNSLLINHGITSRASP